MLPKLAFFTAMPSSTPSAGPTYSPVPASAGGHETFIYQVIISLIWSITIIVIAFIVQKTIIAVNSARTRK